MFRKTLAALFLTASAAAAQDTAISDMIATDGLAATEAKLSADQSTPTQQFALGGVRFLRAIEKTLQTRWRLGMNTDFSELPVLRLPVPANETPDPFTPDAITQLFEVLNTDLVAAAEPLGSIADTDAVDLPIRLTDLWFDINMNASRDEGEGVAEVGGIALTGRPTDIIESPVIHFDTADAAWLAAYTHFLSAFGELLQAFDPTEQIARVSEASAAMAALGDESGYSNALDYQFGTHIDRVAIILMTLNQQPDATHTRAAHAHLVQMIAHNEALWARVAAETDNQGEWIPNDNQQQALGLEVPEGTGETWQAVLADAKALLNGDKLIPYWRLREGAGLNLQKMFHDPVPVDLVEWVHGIALLPFAEEGERVTPDNWFRFERMMRGDALLFVAFLN